MRTTVNILLVLMAAFVVGIISWRQHTDATAASRLEATKSAIRRIGSEINYRAVTEQGEMNDHGWPETVDPAWFGPVPPQNLTVPGDRPWLEVARGADASLLHPATLVSTNDEIAAFWYNPSNGIVRGRVGPVLSDQRALETYNAINGTNLTSLFVAEPAEGEPTIIAVEVDDAFEEKRAEPIVRVRPAKPSSQP